MKLYEKTSPASGKLIPMLPTFARIDGKSFHTFCKGLNKPFDDRLIEIMQNTTKFLVKETNASIGYTQSDEITLMWYSDSYDSQIFFDGKLYKMISVLASMTTEHFMRERLLKLPILQDTNKSAYFDCRVWQVPNKIEACNVFKWREADAVRNSVSMLAQSLYSHKELHGKRCGEMQELCFQKGQNWNNLPDHKKRGTYFGRTYYDRPLTKEVIETLPEHHNARKNPDLFVRRSEIIQLDLPILNTVTNLRQVIFRGFATQ